MGMFGQTRKPQPVHDSEKNLEEYGYHSPRPERIITSVCYVISLIFLILVMIGNINNNTVIRSTYFLKINLSNVVPQSVPNAQLINSIAQTIGLHDFYQVGLWSFCEGYNGEGITFCSRPKTLYWFNPVQIILNELLSGATISLPTEVVTVLHIVRTASFWMFVSFLIGACLTFLCIFFAPMAFSHKPRWTHKTKRIFLRSLPIMVLTFCTALFTIGASVIATVMFVIFRNTFSSAAEFNIHATLGKPMLAFMWTASGFNFLGWLVQLGTCCGICCCTGRRKAQRRRHEAISSERGKGPVMDGMTKRRSDS